MDPTTRVHGMVLLDCLCWVNTNNLSELDVAGLSPEYPGGYPQRHQAASYIKRQVRVLMHGRHRALN